MTTPDEPGTERADDYEYDLAHEMGEIMEARNAAPRNPQPAPPAMHIADDGSDYSYDASHDQA